MDIFESLENLNVSEECFDDILRIVEDLRKHDEIDENIDDVKANLDRERAKKLEDAHGYRKDRYGRSSDALSYTNYLIDYYKNRAEKHDSNSAYRNEFSDPLHSVRRTSYGGDQYNYNPSKDRTLHSIAKHLKKGKKKEKEKDMSENLVLSIFEEVENILEDIISQAAKVAPEKYPYSKEKQQKLIDKAVDVKYGIGKYKRDLDPYRPTKNEVGEKKTDMRRNPMYAGSKSEKEAIEASKFRNQYRTSKERREALESRAETARAHAAERAVGA